MTITITKGRKGRATITVDGTPYSAAYDATLKRWIVQTPQGPHTSASAKVKSCAAIFVPITVTGAAPKRRFSTRPRAPRAARVPGASRAGKQGGPAFATAAPTLRGIKMVILSQLEDLFVTKLRDKGVTQDDRDAYAKYEKLKALALGPSMSTAAQTEADSALRMATINLVKISF